jgi:hypothetical protein
MFRGRRGGGRIPPIIVYEGENTMALDLGDAWVLQDGFNSLEVIKAEEGMVEGKVSWKGLPSEDDTWEWPEGLEEVLKEWEERKAKWGRGYTCSNSYSAMGSSSRFQAGYSMCLLSFTSHIYM